MHGPAAGLIVGGMNKALAVLLAVVVCLASVAHGQPRPKAIMKGSYEDQVLEHEGKQAYGAAVGDFGDLLSPAEKRNGKYEVIAQPGFFLLPPRAQQTMLKQRAESLGHELSIAATKPGQKASLRRVPPDSFRLAIVYMNKAGTRVSAGTFKMGANGMKIAAGPAKTAGAMADADEASRIKDAAEKLK